MKTLFSTVVGLAAGLLVGVTDTMQAQDLSFLINGLVGYWPFDEGQGTMVVDWSGHENNGESQPGVTWDEGVIGHALRFDGTSESFVRVPSSASLNVSRGLTIAAWVQAESIGGVIASKWSDVDQEWSYIFKTWPSIELSKAVHNDLVTIFLWGQAGPPGAWAHFATTFDAASGLVRLYINAQVIGEGHTTGGSIQPCAAELLFGTVRQGVVPTEMFQGVLDEVRLYSRALSETEVRLLYEYRSTILPDFPPVIETQPLDQAVGVGEDLTLAVRTYGTWPLTYQWRKDGADLTGATNALLVLTNVTLADSGEYTVTVSNTYGSATSIPAVVEVSLKPPEITVQPTDQTVCSGAPVSLSVSAAGSPPVTYQWRRNELELADGDRITGAHTATLTLSAAGVEDIGLYSVSVSNAAGRVTSQSAVLGVVLSPPRITEQPRSQAAALGSTVSLAVGATGSLPFTYQWQCNGEDLGDGSRIAGSQAGVLQISALCPDDLGSYTVTVANAFGSVRSSATELTTSSAVLDTSVEAGLLTVSWNAPGRGMILQWTPSLTNPNWQDIPESELTSQMTCVMTEATVYFRLFGTLSQELVAYYPLDGDANDHSGYGNHGTLVNVAPAADRFGQPGGAVRFNGIDGYAELPQSEQLSWLEETNEVTISAWTYLATSSHWESASYICKYNIGDDWGWEILANPDEIWFGFRVPEDSYRHCFDSQQHLQWIQVVVTGSRTRQQVCFYLNGDPITSGTVNDFHLKTTIGPLYLGYSPMGPDEFRASLMDDLRLYSRALSESEVRMLHEYESRSR